MKFLQNKLLIFIIVTLLCLVMIISFFINKLSKKESNQTMIPTVPASFPTISLQDPTEINPSYKKNGFIPTYTPEKGRGVDLEAPIVASSIQEIKKLYPFLPYENVIKNPNTEITIIIPDTTSQTNPWTLEVDIFGLDYRLLKEDPEYSTMKSLFLSTVASINKWIEEKGADPKKIMIIWGDKEYIQNKSQEWME